MFVLKYLKYDTHVTTYVYGIQVWNGLKLLILLYQCKLVLIQFNYEKVLCKNVFNLNLWCCGKSLQNQTGRLKVCSDFDRFFFLHFVLNDHASPSNRRPSDQT